MRPRSFLNVERDQASALGYGFGGAGGTGGAGGAGGAGGGIRAECQCTICQVPLRLAQTSR